MQTIEVKFAPLGKEKYQYTIIPCMDDSFLILIDGKEVCRIQMKQDGTDTWNIVGDDCGLTDNELDFLGSKIESHYK